MGRRVLPGCPPRRSCERTGPRTDSVSVIDASVFVDALVGVGVHGDRARGELRDKRVLQVPAVFGAEAVSALRGLVMRGDLELARARTALEQVRRVRTLQHPFEPFAPRVWELRNSMTLYDAWYVALAEGLGTDLVTTDSRLIKAEGPRCQVRRPGFAS